MFPDNLIRKDVSEFLIMIWFKKCGFVWFMLPATLSVQTLEWYKKKTKENKGNRRQTLLKSIV